MAKKNSAPYEMNRGERIGGTIFFLLYFLVLPVCITPLFDLLEKSLGVVIGASLRNSLYYYVLFAVCILLFHSYLAKTTSRFFDNLNQTLGSFLLGLVAFYGGNELVFRAVKPLFGAQTNLNDTAIAVQVESAPLTTAVIVLFLAPFVEETLFRGFLFGSLKSKSRIVAYLLSCTLFAAIHVWTFAVFQWDLRYLALLLQYLVPGFVFAFVYDKSGTLWAPVLLHVCVNALAFFLILL